MIDYKPRREAAKAARNRRPLERVVFDRPVERKQRFPIYEVIAGGKSIEFTDLRGVAHAVYEGAATLPKSLSAIHEGGRRVLLGEVNALGYRS